MKTKQTKPDLVKITGKCTGCQQKQVLTDEQIKDAEIGGCAMSTCCFMPMTIEKVDYKPSKSK